MGLVSGPLGLAAAAGSRRLLRSHQRIYPLFPEMQIGSHTGGSEVGEQAADSSTAHLTVVIEFVCRGQGWCGGNRL